MKKRTLFYPILLLISILSFHSCEIEDDGIPRFIPTIDIPTIADIVRENPDMDSLEVVLTRINLIHLFNDSSYTLFAPSNLAFRNYLDSNNFQQIADISETKLTRMMHYSTLWYRIVSDSLIQGHSLSTLNPLKNLVIDRGNGLQLITTDTSQGPVNIVFTDIKADNGIVNIVGDILRP
ncbi:MAG: fasciclin domain-containing protein [Flavobacteriales bacterium]|nr:fasciclin domain-containing protein [Flavobacteriales bacterium]